MPSDAQRGREIKSMSRDNEAQVIVSYHAFLSEGDGLGL